MPSATIIVICILELLRDYHAKTNYSVSVQPRFFLVCFLILGLLKDCNNAAGLDACT